MRLRRFITVEIIAHLVAERDDPEDFPGRGEVATPARIEILDRAAQFGQVLADAGFLIHRAGRAVEEAVRLPRRVANLLLTHRADRIDALAEFGRVDVLCDQVVDEGIDPGLQLRTRGIVDRHQSDRLFGRNHGHGIGRGQHQIGRLGVGRRIGRGGHAILQRLV